MIFLLTAIGLTPDGSSAVHFYTKTIHRTTQSKQTIHRTTQSTQTLHRTTQSTQKIHMPVAVCVSSRQYLFDKCRLLYVQS